MLRRIEPSELDKATHSESGLHPKLSTREVVVLFGRDETDRRIFFDQAWGSGVATVEHHENSERGFSGTDRKRDSRCAIVEAAAEECEHAAQASETRRVLLRRRRHRTNADRRGNAHRSETRRRFGWAETLVTSLQRHRRRSSLVDRWRAGGDGASARSKNRLVSILSGRSETIAERTARRAVAARGK